MGKLTKKDANYFKSEIEKILSERVLCTEVLKESNGLLYGTFGYHDCEPPHSIIERKSKEPISSTERFGLWGTCITEEGVNRIKLFCEELEKQENDIYLFLKFTENLSQARSKNIDRTIWSLEKVREDEKIYTHYLVDGEEVKIPRQIVVKGSSRQNIAFVFEEIFKFRDSFDRNDMLSHYTGTLYNGDTVKSAEELFKISPCFLLTKKNSTKDEIFFREGNSWGIVLKLKAPYIVECIKK